MKLFMSSIPPPVTDSGGVNIDYGFHTDYPLRLDSVLFLDQVGLDAGTIGRIDSISFDRYGRVMVVNTGQSAYFVYTDAPSSLDEFRLERFYNGSYADPRLSSNSVTSGSITVSPNSVSHVRFSPNNYVYILRDRGDKNQDFQIRGNVESTGTLNTFSGGNFATTTDYGTGQLNGMSWYGGYVYISVGNQGNGNSTITRYDFAEPTAAEYETLAAGGTFNPTTNGMFSNPVAKNITSAGGPNWSAAPEAHFNHDGTILILTLQSAYGQLYYFNCPTAYDHSSITSFATADALSYSSAQYYDLGVAFRAGYACSVGQVKEYYTFPYPDSNGDNSMVIVTGVTASTTNDEEYVACLFRWETTGQPDPLPTIHIDFESTNTYLVNTHYPSATISYTQNTQYAVVGSNCAYINGTTGSELIITEPNVGNIDQRDFMARSHTLSAWFRFSSLSGIVDLVSQGGSSTRPKFRYDASNGYFTMSVTDNSRGVFEQRWNYTLSTDTWYHIVYMCSVDGSAVSTAPADGKGMILFVNGTELTRTYKSTNYSTLLNSTLMAYRSQIMTCSTLQGLNNDPPDYWIGRGSTGVMTGYVDDVRLYKARLPDSFVTTLYNLKNTSIESFTYTSSSITITKSKETAVDWSWTLNGVSQGTVTGASGLTQTITGLSLFNGDVVVITMTSSSVTETLSGFPARITSFTTPNSQRIVITKDASDATNWSWSLNGVSQGTITGASGTSQTYNFTNKVLQNGDTVAVTMSGSTVTQTVSGLEVTSFSINYCVGGRTLTRDDPNDVFVYLYDNNSGETFEVHSWGDNDENNQWETYTNSSINFRTSSMRVIMKFVDGPHVHDTGIYSVTLNNTTKDFTSDFAGFTINNFVSTNFNISTATSPSGSWTRRSTASSNGSNILVSAHPTGNSFFFYEGSGNTSDAGRGTAWIISPTIDPTLNELTDFSFTSSSITITKTLSEATNWSWTLNGVSQGTVSGASGTSQTLTGVTLAHGDVVVVAMNSSSVTKTISLATTPYTVAFHYGSFDNVYGDGNVTAAANNGHLYDNSPTGTYSWGTLNSRSTASGQTTYSWTPPIAITTNVLMVGGGGGGGRRTGGGGGGGGLVFKPSHSVSSSAQTIKVGDGGNGSTSRYAMGTQGKNTTAFGFTAIGGGAGCCDTHAIQSTANGGSGGGAEWNRNIYGFDQQPGSSTGGYGNDGGQSNGGRVGGAGGGGASANGGHSTTGSGLGGDGHYQVTISSTTYNFKNVFGSGYGDVISTQSWFAGGGGGGTFKGSSHPLPIGGKGGGGDGGKITSSNATVGQAHTGGGGGGDGRDVANGRDGGSGIVLLNFLGP